MEDTCSSKKMLCWLANITISNDEQYNVENMFCFQNDYSDGIICHVDGE
nr:MAG TPA: hypothetical protein [Caudoviricetes sp.]